MKGIIADADIQGHFKLLLERLQGRVWGEIWASFTREGLRPAPGRRPGRHDASIRQHHRNTENAFHIGSVSAGSEKCRGLRERTADSRLQSRQRAPESRAQTGGLQGAFQSHPRHSGFHGHVQIALIDLENPIHPAHVDYGRTLDRREAPLRV